MDNSLKELEKLLIEKKLRGLEDLYFFNKYIMEQDPERRKFLVPHVHGEWSLWYRGSRKRIKMILVPRACFKSTFFTVGRTLQAIAQNRNHRILIANATLENAQRFLGAVKTNIKGNETYKQLYGDMYDKSLKWNESEIEVAGRALGHKEATVTAVGVGGNLVSQHYSMIIADDLVNLENSATRYQSEKVIDWWKRAFSLLDYDGEMIIIGTRWSYYELYSYILDQMGDQVDYLIRGAYKSDGEPYFPEMLSHEKLQELKKLQGSYVFSAFYLNDPVDEDSALIKKSHLRYYGDTEEQKLPKNVTTFAMCDPAVSQDAYADYSTIVIVSVDIFDNWYVREVRRGKWTVGELVDNLFSVKKQWDPATMTIELIGQAQGLMDSITNEEERRREYLPIVAVKSRPQIRKEMRIRSILQPRFERHKIFLQRNMFELEEELLKFPKSEHDDIIDPLTDLESISFPPDLHEEGVLKPQTELERRAFDLNRSDFEDPYMGEDY